VRSHTKTLHLANWTSSFRNLNRAVAALADPVDGG
jgi:hypothetical protein